MDDAFRAEKSAIPEGIRRTAVADKGRLVFGERGA
jgi:hypothetical protein